MLSGGSPRLVAVRLHGSLKDTGYNRFLLFSKRGKREIGGFLEVCPEPKTNFERVNVWQDMTARQALALHFYKSLKCKSVNIKVLRGLMWSKLGSRDSKLRQLSAS
jgi:hypothetical protein